MPARILACLLLAVWLGSPAHGGGFEVSWEPETVPQGGVVRLTVRGPPSLPRPEGRFDGKALRFWHGPTLGHWIAWAGADLDTRPPSIPLVVEAAGETRTLGVPARLGEFPEERLSLPEGQVSPRAPAVLKRISGDQKRARAAGMTLTESPFHGRLRIPAAGRRNHNFGKRRILNGKSRSPHGGEDISAAEGTPVVAAADGVVRLVDDMFYSGNTVFLDHGSGWMTTYFHLSEVAVREGQRVAAGDPVGRVGRTGRATGPHLHWGLQWLRSRLDPLQLVPQGP